MSFVVITAPLFSQTRISDIQNLVPVQNTPKIAKVGDTEYLIEQNNETTTISKILSDKVELSQTLKHKPPTEERVAVYKSCEVNDALIYRGNQLVEVFSKSVFLTDITTGELKKKIELRADSLTFINYGGLEGDSLLILHAGTANNKNYFVFVHLETGNIFINSTDINNKTSMIGLKFYSFSENQIISVDVFTSEKDTVLFTSSPVYQMMVFSSDCNPGLAIFTEDGTIYIRDKEKLIHTVECLKEKRQFYKVYLKNDMILFTYNDGLTRSRLFNLKTCADFEIPSKEIIPVQIQELPANNIIFEVRELYSTRYILLQNDGSFSYRSFPNNINFILRNNFYVKDNFLYFAGQYVYNITLKYTTLYKLDLTSGTAIKIDPTDEFTVVNVLFNSFHNNVLKVLRYKSDFTADMYSYTENEPEIKFVSKIHQIKNTGIPDIQRVFFNLNHIFTYSSIGLFKSRNNSDVKLADYKSSVLLKSHKDHLFMVGELENKVYGYKKINMITNETTYKILENSFHSNIKLYETPCSVMKEDWNDTNKRFTLNLDTEKYNKETNFSANRITYFVGSAFNTLLGQQENNNLRLQFYENCKEEVKSTQFLTKGFDAYSVGDGSLYYTNSAQPEREIFKMNQDLSIQKALNIPACNSFNNTKIRNTGLEGDIRVLPFKMTNDLLFVFDVKGNFSYKTIPYKNAINWDNIFWRKNGDIILVAVPENNKPDLQPVVIKIGEEPRYLLMPFNNYRMSEAIIDGDDLLILFVHTNFSNAKMVHYKYSLDEVVHILDASLLNVNILYDQGHVLKLNDQEYLFNFSGSETGKEPWIYHKTDHSFRVLQDIRAGKESSDPQNFTMVGQSLYFTAIDNDGSRQWFAYNHSPLSNGNELKDSPIKLIPNPAFDYLLLLTNDDVTAYTISIRNISGQLIEEFTIPYSQYIDVSGYSPGLYVVTATTNNKSYSHKFVRM